MVNGRITNCSVHGNLCETGLQAFQFSWASRCIIENCTAYDNSGRYVWGFYHDTGSFHRVDIAHNRFLGVDIGARILCSPDSYHSDTTIFANEFRISGAANGSGKAGIEYAGSNRTGGIRVIANRILLAPTLAGSICVTLNSQSGALILVNMFAGFTTPVFLPNAGDTVVRGNLGEFGEPVGAGLGRSVP